MQKRLERVYLVIFILMSFGLNAQEYVFEHANCKIKIQKQEKIYQSVEKLLKSLLTKKGYEVTYLVDNRKILPKDLYMTMTIDTPSGKLFKDCIVTIKMKVAKNRRISAADNVLFEREGKRHVPRITFKGLERCRRALKDDFIHIPYCKEIGYAGERR